MPEVELAETCRCGASVTVKGLDRRDATDTVDRWRTKHRCIHPTTPGKAEPQPSGAGCAVIGFNAPTPTVNARNMTGRTTTRW